MFIVFLALIAIVCFLLIIVIMVQNPKGGGLSSSLGGSQQLGGVQKTTDFLDKSTWTLATVLILLILFSGMNFSDDAPAVAPIEAAKPAGPAATPAKPDATPAKPADATTTPGKTVSVPVEAPATTKK
ncbi:MAG: preprotein translocase subunit SecG [Flavobacterium sp. BFFFF1]|uniref:preprotein translocase subunit SecG n=1 Tax=unclassified Flavobacterium TaxID=196869 RepID=UPI000BC9AD94|nr:MULTISPECIES: preprotein translocase subunit SecG [unclassified Flavobacterium]OYU80415.1 MAG: preprotein translocase subunit SecG [Flavobacterium sp. BFFFF1]